MNLGPDEYQNTFSLRKTFSHEYFSRIVMSLPSITFFENAEENLTPAQFKYIRDCFSHLYAYPVQREAIEGNPTYFHHVAGTISWEIFHNERINGADHITKAHQIYRMVKKSILELSKIINNKSVTVNQANILKDTIKLLEAHESLLSEALSYCSAEQLTLKQNQLDSPFKKQSLSPNTKIVVDKHYLDINHPTTPKKASENDTASINKLRAYKAKKKLQFSSASSSSEEEIIDNETAFRNTNTSQKNTEQYLLQKFYSFNIDIDSESDHSSNSFTISSSASFSDEEYLALTDNTKTEETIESSHESKPQLGYKATK